MGSEMCIRDSLRLLGYLTVYQGDDDKEEANSVLEKLTKDSQLSMQELLPEQHFTQPP